MHEYTLHIWWFSLPIMVVRHMFNTIIIFPTNCRKNFTFQMGMLMVSTPIFANVACGWHACWS